MESVPENTTVEEYTHNLAMQLASLPEGEMRDGLAEHFVSFRAEIDLLETCFEINPYDQLPKSRSTGSPE